MQESDLSAEKSAEKSVFASETLLADVYKSANIDFFHQACSDLGARINSEVDEMQLTVDFSLFAHLISLIASLPTTRSSLEVEVGALHRHKRPDTTKVMVSWEHEAADETEIELLAGTGCTIISDQMSIELPLPPELGRRLWARYALEMHYACESAVELTIHIPQSEAQAILPS